MNNFPLLLVDKEKCSRNIEKVAQKCKQLNLNLRPHFKTHQSLEIGELYRKYGVTSITVSSVAMAEFFANSQWDDILLAFPIYPQITDRVNALASKIRLGIIFSSLKNLLKSVELITAHVEVYIEVDTGYGRSGTSPANTREIAVMINLIEQHQNLTFRGFVTHAGQTYLAKSTNEILQINKKSMCALSGLKQFWKESHPNIIVSYGDTPSASLAQDFWAADELRAGNFVYYDVMQSQLGSCSPADVAVALIAPIVDIYKSRGEALLHAGAVHLSKEFINIEEDRRCFGLVCPYNAQTKKWGSPIPNAFIKSISQEHGILTFDPKDAEQFEIGDLLAILPIHSCLTANLMLQNTVFNS